MPDADDLWPERRIELMGHHARVRSTRIRSAAAVSVAAVALTAAPAAHSQPQAWVVPAVSLSLSHDDNVFLSPGGSADTLMLLTPSLTGSYQTPTREIQGSASFEAQVSAQHPVLNALGARRNALIDARLRTSPVMSVGLGARYDRTDSPTELNVESGVLLGRQHATRRQVTPSASYRLRPRATVTARYDWTTESLSGLPLQSLHAARVGMDYAASARTQWGGGYLARAFAGSPIDPLYSHALLVTWTRQMAPGTNLSIHAGPRVSSYNPLTPELFASFFRRTPRQRFLLDYWHGETIVLGVAGPVAVHSGTNRTSWLLRNRLEISTVVGVFRSETLTAARAVVYHGGVGGAWMLRGMYTLTATYRADFQRGDLRRQWPSDQRLRRGVLLLGVTMAPRLSRIVATRGLEPGLPTAGVLRP